MVRGLARLLASGLLLALAGVALATVFREPIVRLGLLALLDRQGFANARIGEVEVGLNHLQLRDLDLGPGEAAGVRVLTVEFTLRGLLASRLDLLTLDGLRLPAAFGPAGARILGIDPFADGSEGSGPRLPLPARIRIEDALLTVDVDQPRFASGDTVRVRLDAEGSTIRLDGTLVAEVEGGVGFWVECRSERRPARSAAHGRDR